jgi:hypothetical protein
MQAVLGHTPTLTGLAPLVTLAFIMIAGSQVPRLLRAWGYKPILFVASVIIALSQLLLTVIPADGDYWANLLPGFVLLGIGAGFGPITVAATSGVHWSQTGLASGLVNTSQRLGGCQGLAILTGVPTSVATSSEEPTGGTSARRPRLARIPHRRQLLRHLVFLHRARAVWHEGADGLDRGISAPGRLEHRLNAGSL